MDFERHMQLAVTAAQKGARTVRSHFGNISQIRKKAAEEIVTEADTAAEEQIINAIRSDFPEHGILSEERGLSKSGSEYRWIIDPLDGTVNFAHQVPIFSVSIALSYRDCVVLGVVLDPINDEIFSAANGQGARLNGRPIRVSTVTNVRESLLVSGFPYNVNEVFEPLITRWGNCLRAAQAVRRLGSAALDLCYVACGRFEGYWEQNLKPWDTAAGALIAAEAGARVTTFSDQPYTIDRDEILATNGGIHAQMLGLLQI